jgi:hypothetical protein
MVFKTTNTGSTIKSTKMTISSGGVYINSGSNEFLLPADRGTGGQVLTSSGSGGTSWSTPVFIPYHYNYQTSTLSTVVDASTSTSVVTTAGGENTSVTVVSSGTYTAHFSADLILSGNLPQRLTARVLHVITELENLTFTTLPAIDIGNQTLTAGNYTKVAACTLTGTLTLSGSATDIFIFKIVGAYNPAASSSVILSGSVQSKNVFWIITGAYTQAANSTSHGVVLCKGAATLADTAVLIGRIYTIAGLITFANNSNITLIPPDTSPLITLGVLEPYSIYNSSGNITRTGIPMTNFGAIKTGAGNISGFGSYDGTGFTSGIIQPSIWVDFSLFKAGVLVPESMRCINNPRSDCQTVTMLTDIVCAANDVVDVRISVIIADTSTQLKNRCLSLTKRYV